MYYVDFIQSKDLERLKILYEQLTGDNSDILVLKEAFNKINSRDDVKIFGLYNDDDILIATGQITRCPDLTADTSDYYSLENFVVDESMRRKGIGSILLRHIENYVRDNNGRYINFTSSSKRVKAHKFYKKNGYDIDKVKGFKKHISHN